MTIEEQINNIVDSRLDTKIKVVMETVVKPLQDELARIKSGGEVVEEYMPIRYFLNKYEISAKTFRQVLKVNYVGSRRVFKHKHFHVQQWNTALSMYTGKKPTILNIG